MSIFSNIAGEAQNALKMALSLCKQKSEKRKESNLQL